MKELILKKIFIIAMILSIVCSVSLLGKKKTIEDVRLDDMEIIQETHKYYPKGDAKIINTNSGRFAVVYEDSTLYFVLSTADYSEIKGYKGYSNLLIFLSSSGIVDRIVFVNSDDTKPWVHKVLDSDILQELSAQDLFTEERPIFLVTGATITSSAFNKNVTRTLNCFKNVYKQLKIENTNIILPDSLKE